MTTNTEDKEAPLRVDLNAACLTVGDLIRTLRFADPALPVFVQPEGGITKALTRVVAVHSERPNEWCAVLLMIQGSDQL